VGREGPAFCPTSMEAFYGVVPFAATMIRECVGSLVRGIASGGRVALVSE
jgi:hypothetical protein